MPARTNGHPTDHAVGLIAAERRRQVDDVQLWTPEHDDKYTAGELALAAASYAAHSTELGRTVYLHLWPWAHIWWKPKSRIRDAMHDGSAK